MLGATRSRAVVSTRYETNAYVTRRIRSFIGLVEMASSKSWGLPEIAIPRHGCHRPDSILLSKRSAFHSLNVETVKHVIPWLGRAQPWGVALQLSPTTG